MAHATSAPVGGVRFRTRLGRWAQAVLPLAAGLGLWQFVTAQKLLPVIALPEPWRVADEAWELLANGRLVQDSATTVTRILVALAIAAVLGILGGLVIGRVAAVRRATQPLVRVAFPVPKIALYPGLIILFGAGATSAIALGAAEAFFPVLLGTASAASQVNQKLLWSAQALGTRPVRLVTRVVLPEALPGVLMALRVGLVGAIVGVFLGEMIAGSDGLGQLMARGWTLLESPQMYVALMAMALIGLFLDSVLLAARRWLLRGSDEE
jgi:NitT/TauT family transport system permease protein